MSQYRFAVVLGGCGNKDGAEIHESVATLLAIDEADCSYQCFAPDKPQATVINYLTDASVEETRNVLLESARIARGQIQSLDCLDIRNFDALVIPGGFGVAMNLCTFAQDKQNMEVIPQLRRIIEDALKARQPIGALCIAPIILAKIIPGVTVTFGQDEQVNAIAQGFGAKTRNTSHGDIVIDQDHRVVTTPCYMLDARISQVAQGVRKLVRAMVDLLDKGTPSA